MNRSFFSLTTILVFLVENISFRSDTRRAIIASKTRGRRTTRTIILRCLWPLALLGTGGGGCLTFSISRGSYVSSFHSRNIYQIFLLPHRSKSPRFAKISSHFLPSSFQPSPPFRRERILPYLVRKPKRATSKKDDRTIKGIAGVPRRIVADRNLFLYQADVSN